MKLPACLVVAVLVVFAQPASAAPAPAPAPSATDIPEPSTALLRAAVTKSLPLLTAGARGSMEKRERCFTCHNQGLPIMALTTAQARGFNIDTNELRTQLQFTADFLAKNRTNYLAGKGQGGQADTAGYALWALANGAWKPDATTAAVAEYLLVWQQNLVHWKPQSRRPPSEQSLFTSTHAALRGLKNFGTAEQRERIDRRIAQVRAWLLKTPPPTPKTASSVCARSIWPGLPRPKFTKPRRICLRPSRPTAAGPSSRNLAPTPTRPAPRSRRYTNPAALPPRPPRISADSVIS